ncbi:unnamed protein product [Durusdinium trenchii]|uniref:Uncharacterized protein n=3 Tax=Durusdinium trenchii TaxID=1381693 RepID=A0ABP0QI76_9DINO
MAFAKKPRTTGIELPKMPGDSPALTQRTGSMGSLAASRKRLPTNAPKVFVITGNPESANLDVVRQELLTRGFTEGAVGEAEDFLLKWGPRSKVDWRSLAPPQLVNHYENDAALTTKSGLAENLQSTSSPHDARQFFPSCFHLDRASAIFEFAQEFKFSKACCVLKEWLAHKEAGIVPETFHDEVIRTALVVVKRRLEDIDSQLMGDTDEAKQVDYMVKKREWDVLSAVDFENPGENPACQGWQQLSLKRKQSNLQKKQLLERYDRKLQQIAEHGKAKTRRKKREGSVCSLKEAKEEEEEVEEKEEEATKSLTRERSEKSLEEPMKLSGSKLMEAVTAVLGCLKEHPQFHLNRRNIWILKPSNSLRGHGIVVENDLERLLRHARGKSCSYVCQKYIENPLLIGGARKHDIRQWAMVTSLNPLTIYFFSECYVRIAAEDYSLDDFGDRFKHLTHTVIMKNHPNFNPDDEDWRCQWTQERYRTLLLEKAGYDVWKDKIRPAMQQIVVASLLSVAEVLTKSDNHSCCFQLFGYDFMVDENYNVWLLEVNDIPMLQASGPVTSRLCDTCLRQAFRTIFDAPSSNPERSKTDEDNLHFEPLYRGPEIPKLPKTASQGLDFSVDGRKLLPKCSPGPVRHAPSLRLSARRDQELQDLVDKRRLREGKEQQEKERQLRLRRSLAKKLLGGKSISSPCLEQLQVQVPREVEGSVGTT